MLIDGDWYVCCGTGDAEELMTLSCMKESEIGPAERASKVDLKNRSMVSTASSTSKHLFYRTKSTITEENTFKLLLN